MSDSAGAEMGITHAQMKNAMKSSAVTSIGPSIVVLSGMLSLLVTVGAPGVRMLPAPGHTYGNSIVAAEDDGLFYMLHGD